MTEQVPKSRPTRSTMTAMGATLVLSAGLALAAAPPLRLTGDQESPPVVSSASATSNITVAADKSVHGAVSTSGIAGTAAHIHAGEPGKNGPPVVILAKTSDNVCSVPDGAKLTDEQYASYKAGNLYVNVHSADHKGGEIRAQLKP